MTPKSAPPRGWVIRPHLVHGSLGVGRLPKSKRHLDRLSHLCRLYGNACSRFSITPDCVRQNTDRRTDGQIWTLDTGQLQIPHYSTASRGENVTFVWSFSARYSMWRASCCRHVYSITAQWLTPMAWKPELFMSGFTARQSTLALPSVYWTQEADWVQTAL